MSAARAALLLAVAAFLPACSVLEWFTGPAPPRPIPAILGGRSTADELVLYAGRLRGLNDAALAGEAARHRKEGSDLGRLKAAMALALSSQADDGEIAALVEPVARKDHDAEAKSMASYLLALVGERRRLRESAVAAGVKLRDERRAMEAQKQRADALQERAAQLQQKLDALTELEKSLSDRQNPSR